MSIRMRSGLRSRGEADAVLAGDRLERRVALRLQDVAHELHVLFVVFDDQYETHRFPRYRLVGNREGERRALARFAFEPDASAVQLDELAREREAEARAFLLVRVVAADLAEFLEHRLLVLRRDADAGVADGDYEHLVRVAARDDVDAAAVGRELDRVGQQVEQDLLELALVGDDLAERRVDVERRARCRAAARARGSASSRWRWPTARRTAKARAPCARPRPSTRSRMSLMSMQQVLAGRVDVLQVVVLLLVELAEHPLEQHFGEADDRVERRAQLVRHVGEELATCAGSRSRAAGSCPGSRGTAARSRSRSPPGRRTCAGGRSPVR